MHFLQVETKNYVLCRDIISVVRLKAELFIT